MIKLEHAVLASPEQMQFVIEGMRNPMNSWDKSDSGYNFVRYDVQGLQIGDNDYALMQKLAKAGTDHRKFMRMMPVMVRITAPLYWWKEFDTYKVDTVANSCSTMHKIAEKEFTLEDFSCEHLHGWDGVAFNEYLKFECGREYTPKDSLVDTIRMLNFWRSIYLKKSSKDAWWQMIQLLPLSYNQTRNVMMNYEVLANMHHSRKNHKLNEWRNFCKWIESLPYSELITGNEISELENLEARR